MEYELRNTSDERSRRNYTQAVEFGETQRLAPVFIGWGDEEEVPHREVGANGLANRTLSL